MKKLIALFSIFFMVQMEASDREITYTTKDQKGKDPLPEKTPLLINKTSSMSAQKKKLKSRFSEESLKASLTHNIINLPKEIRVLIFEKLYPFDDARKDDQKYCNARNAIKDIVENKPCSLGLLFKAFYAVEARRHIPLDFGIVNTNLDIIDILDLDDNSAAKLQDLLHEKLAPCCWGYSRYPSCLKVFFSPYPQISVAELESLKIIFDERGLEIRDDKTNPDTLHCGTCLGSLGTVATFSGVASLLCACLAKEGCCFHLCPCVSIKAAETTAFSLLGTGGGCLLIGVICCAGNSCGKDCKPLTSLRSITKKTK